MRRISSSKTSFGNSFRASLIGFVVLVAPSAVHALDASVLESRIAALEARVAALEGKSEPTRTESNRQAAAEPPAADHPPAPQPEPTKSFSDQQIELSRAEVAKLLGEKKASSRTLPVFRDGNAIGVSTIGIKPDGLFARLGLVDGDIIRSLDGESLGEPPSLRGMLEALKAGKSVAIGVERQGGTFTLQIMVN